MHVIKQKNQFFKTSKSDTKKLTSDSCSATPITPKHIILFLNFFWCWTVSVELVEKKNLLTTEIKLILPAAVVDPSDALFEPVAFLSSDPVHSKPSKFQTTILPIYLPPIQTQLVSEQLRRNISDSPVRVMMRRADSIYKRRKIFAVR